MGGKTKSPQLDFFSELGMKRTPRTSHGGASSQGKRKVARPLDRRRPLHIVLRSSKARREWSLLRTPHRRSVDFIVQKQAKKFGVRVSDFANVGNHIHFMVRFSSPVGFRNFLRTVTAMIARAVTGARRGKTVGKFWDFLAFTRVVRTWTEEKVLRRYLHANQIEAREGKFAREWFLAGFG